MAPRLAMALPAAGCLAAAPLFVGAPVAPATRNAVQATSYQQAQSSSLSAVATGTAAAAVVAAVSSRSGAVQRTKIVRQFFGDSGSGSSYRAFDPATELGVQDPIGFWDPLGLSADKDEATFKRRRAVEIKHGRISMYATIGYIVPEYFKFPGYLSPSLGLKFEDVPNGLAALSKLPVLGGAQIIAFAGLIETTGFFQAKSTTDGRGPREGQFSMKDSTEAAEPGNYGVGFPNFLGKVADPEARKTKLAAELANGRLAMMAIIGMFFQDGLTGSAWGDWALYTASPLRAEPISGAAAAAAAAAAAKAAAGAKAASVGAAATAKAGVSAGAKTVGATTAAGAGTGKSIAGEGEKAEPDAAFDPAEQVGVTQPFGYFDPAGFCKKGDVAGFRNLRAAEIKHGRVAMMAAVGAVVQHYVKFPGFEKVPTGLDAVEVAPGTYGFAALFAAAGALELGAWTEDPSREPGNFGDPAGLNQYTEDMRNRELNNGRMAMFAALGIIAANIVTGKDAIEQFGA